MSANDGRVTLILKRINDGDPAAEHELFDAVYEELRRRAAQLMSRERLDHTLQPTALVNEAFVRLLHGPAGRWSSSRHFYNAVSEAMRRILVDHARRKNAAKRGGGANRDESPVDLDRLESIDANGNGDVDHEALDHALAKLQVEDERRYRVVMYRYFAGLGDVRIAELLDVSEKTVRRDWQTAKMFLLAELCNSDVADDRITTP